MYLTHISLFLQVSCSKRVAFHVVMFCVVVCFFLCLFAQFFKQAIFGWHHDLHTGWRFLAGHFACF